jgi:hypothetical protein
MAPIIRTEATVGAGRSAHIGLRKDRLGCEKGVIAKTLARFNEEGRSRRWVQRGRRIFLLSRGLKRIASFLQFPLNIPRLSGNAELVFYSLVVRLQVGIRERPIDKIYVWRYSLLPISFYSSATHAKVTLQKPP